MSYSQPIVDTNYDSYIATGLSADANFGSDTALLIGHLDFGKLGSTNHHSLLLVDLASYIGSTILSGRLYLKNLGSTFSNANFHLYRCAVTNWTELGCTWNHSGMAPWTGGSPAELYQTLSGLSNPADLDFNGIAALIQDALDNRGGLLSAVVTWSGSSSSTNLGQFGSSENTGNEPLLEFTYDLPAQIAADALPITQLADADYALGKGIYEELLDSAVTIDVVDPVGKNRAAVRELHLLHRALGRIGYPDGTVNNPALAIMVAAGLLKIDNGELKRGRLIRSSSITPSTALVILLCREAAVHGSYTERELREAVDAAVSGERKLERE